MNVFPWFKKAGSRDVLNAVAFSAEGVSVARVQRPADAPPVLESCAFQAVREGHSRLQALTALRRAQKLDNGACTLLVEPESYSLLMVEAPSVPPDEIRAAIRWRVRELIDFHIDDAVIDVFDIPDQKAGARMMYVVAARIPQVGALTELAEQAGLELTVVDIPELAMRNIAAELPEDVSGMALIHLGMDSGAITLTRQSQLFLARRLDFGLRSFPLVADAEAGSASEPVQQWMDGLVVEVQRSLDYYESHFSQPPIGHLAIAPLEMAVPGMADYLAQQLGLQGRMLDLDSLIDCGETVDPIIGARCFPALGAALRTEERSL